MALEDFGIDETALEQAMKDRWGKPAELEGVLPLAELPPDPVEEESEELDLGLGDDDTTDDTTDDSDETEDESEEEQEATSESDTDLIPIGDGRFIHRNQLTYYADIDAKLAQDNAFRAYVEQYGKAPPAPPAPPKPDPALENLDLDDPTTKYLYDRLQEMERRVAQTGQVVTLAQQQQQQEIQSRTISLVNRAAASFQKEHELSDEQMAELRNAAAGIGGVDRYMSGIHPVTGKPVKPDMLAAIDTALTIAFRARDDFIKESQEKITRRQLDNKTRRAKLNKIGGNSGSAPRTPPVPTDAKSRREAFVAEVAGMMNGQS